MNGPRYTINIDRLVLSGLDITPAEAERIRVQVAAELEQALAQRSWSGEPQAYERDRIALPPLSAAEAGDGQRLSNSLARRIARALPGSSHSEAGE
jgi:hypothetical protein